MPKNSRVEKKFEGEAYLHKRRDDMFILVCMVMQTHVGEGQLVGHAAHLGGAAVGFVAWAVLFFGR